MLSGKRPGQAPPSAQLRTVLHWAIRSRKRQLLKLMIEHKAPLDLAGTNKEARSALDVAVHSHYYSIVPRLLDLGAQPGKREWPNSIDLAMYHGQTSLIELFFKRFFRLSSDYGLCYIASRGDTATLQPLIDHRIDLGFYGKAALLYAIKEGHYDMTRLLIDNGASPNYYCRFSEMRIDHNIFWYDAIEFAMHFERIEILKLLLEKGVLPAWGQSYDHFSEGILGLLPRIDEGENPQKENLESLAWFGEQFKEEKIPTSRCRF